MKIESLIDQVRQLIAPFVEELQYELYHVEYVKEQGEFYLRIYIDSPAGIGLQDCEKVSRAISDILDEKDPIPGSYYLEVSSPGLNRYLYNDNHISKNIGNCVLVKLRSNFDGKKVFKGTLVSFDDAEIIFHADGEDKKIPREKIKSINLEGEL